MNYKEKRDDLFDDKSPADSNRNIAMKKGGIKKMGEYKKDMMHERELIYDAKKQEKGASAKTKSNDKKLIYDAKGAIHKEDQRMHVVNRIAGKNNRR